ncbi:MAG: type II toxin-antitoxin system PemK/MazF family toxin [Bacteroidetes bacterium]|nr:type II toxin-antitoxin system PemK/MazF family toxin [Bacteroidota bacterium]MBU2585800.1 type II toxin-antitoxin system PemK/MazF family toxin [Bacteroidota bacterium]
MKQGEIWLINLDPTIGAEIKKTGPAIIVNDNRIGKLPLKVIVPLTDWKNQYTAAPWMVRIDPDNKNNLQKSSSADCFQVRSISELRFVKKWGTIDRDKLEEIKTALAIVLTIE